MRQGRLLILGLSAVLFMHPLGMSNGENSQDIRPSKVQSKDVPAAEAPTGFDNLTNGLTDQATFDADRAVFEEVETTEEGLGPVFNARSCAECHSNPIIGGNSQVTNCALGISTASGSSITRVARSFRNAPLMRPCRSMYTTSMKSGRSASH